MFQLEPQCKTLSPGPKHLYLALPGVSVCRSQLLLFRLHPDVSQLSWYTNENDKMDCILHIVLILTTYSSTQDVQTVDLIAIYKPWHTSSSPTTPTYEKLVFLQKNSRQWQKKIRMQSANRYVNTIEPWDRAEYMLEFCSLKLRVACSILSWAWQSISFEGMIQALEVKKKTGWCFEDIKLDTRCCMAWTTLMWLETLRLKWNPLWNMWCSHGHLACERQWGPPLIDQAMFYFGTLQTIMQHEILLNLMLYICQCTHALSLAIIRPVWNRSWPGTIIHCSWRHTTDSTHHSIYSYCGTMYCWTIEWTLRDCRHCYTGIETWFVEAAIVFN